MNTTPCDCCTSVNQYIAEHLDRDGLITPDCDPTETFITLQMCFPGEDIGITVDDLTTYISSLVTS